MIIPPPTRSNVAVMECQAFRASPLPGGGIRLEIEEPQADALSEKMYLDEIGIAMNKSVKRIDQLSRRVSNPLPLIRGNGRPYALRSQLNKWLVNPTALPGRPRKATLQSVIG